MSLGQEVVFVNQVCATRKEKMTCGHFRACPHVGWEEDHLNSHGWSRMLFHLHFLGTWHRGTDCMGIIFIPSPISNSSCLLCTPNSWHLEQHIKIQPKSSTSWDAPFILLREDLKETAASQEGHLWISINVRNGWWNIDIPRGSKNRIASYPFYVCLSPAPHPDSLASAPSHPHPDKRGLESSNQFQECRKTTVPPINIEVNQAKASPRQRFFNFKCSVAFV